jgi:hypothetical protein
MLPGNEAAPTKVSAILQLALFCFPCIEYNTSVPTISAVQLNFYWKDAMRYDNLLHQAYEQMYLLV